MAERNAEGAEVSARILYWGAEGAGKSSNLRHVHLKLRSDHRGAVREIPTPLDPSVCYESLPITLGELAGMRVHLHVVAPPGGPEHAATRKQLLDRVDGVVLVIDASPDRLDANLESFDELRRALSAYGRSVKDIALVVQYNKRDLSDDLTLEELHRKLDLRGAAVFEAVATEGKGVLQALTTISKRVIRRLRDHEDAARERDLQDPAPAHELQDAAPALRPAAEPAPPRIEPEPPIVEVALAAEEADPGEAALADEAVFAAQSLLDAPIDVAHSHAAPGATDLQIAELGVPHRTHPRAFRIPVTLRDDSGRTFSMTLSVQLGPLEPTET